LYRNNLSPQTTDREVAAMILTPSILKFHRFRLQNSLEKIQTVKSFVRLLSKANKGDISFMKGDFIDTLCK
jgi:hypothetical protein